MPPELLRVPDLAGCSADCLPSTQLGQAARGWWIANALRDTMLGRRWGPAPHELAVEGRRYPFKIQTIFRKFWKPAIFFSSERGMEPRRRRRADPTCLFAQLRHCVWILVALQIWPIHQNKSGRPTAEVPSDPIVLLVWPVWPHLGLGSRGTILQDACGSVVGHSRSPTPS